MNMNISQSNFSRALAKQLKKSAGFQSRPSLEFRTVWKFRDTHKECQKMTTSALSQSVKAQQQQQQEVHAYETAGQQEMKEFIKMMKKNSDESTQISNVAVQQTRGLNTSRSSRSVRSNAKSLCQSRISNQVGQDWSASNRLGLDELEKKIQSAISNKLSKKCSSSAGFLLRSRVQEDELDLELRGLISQVRKYKNKENTLDCAEGAIDNDIREINKKIRIIEKAIASSYTEHEMVIKVFSSTRRQNKKYLIGLKQLPRSNLSCSKLSVSKSPPSIHYETTNMSSFIKPPGGSYVNHAPKKSAFLLNRQPLPRSIYQREFLYYGVVPTYSNSARIEHNLTYQVKNSEKPNILQPQDRKTTYAQDFQTKGQQSQIDAKELDCRVDKFKTTNISFIPKKHDQEQAKDKNNSKPTGLRKIKRKSQQNINYQYQAQCESYLGLNDRKSNKIRNSMCCYGQSNNNNNKQNCKPTDISVCDGGKVVKTEHQSQYQNKGARSAFEPDLKEKTLRDLKYSFKFKYQV